MTSSQGLTKGGDDASEERGLGASVPLLVGGSANDRVDKLDNNSANVVHMRLLDFVVSQALHLNSRCLLMLSQSDGISDLQWRELRGAANQLMAAWQLVRKRVGKSQFREAAGRIEQIHALLPAQVSFARVAQDLLDRAGSSKSRAALRQVMDEWGSLLRAPATSAKPNINPLARLIQVESQAWRLAFGTRGCSNKMIVEGGFGRTYRRAKRTSKNNLKRQKKGGLSIKRLVRWRRRITQLVGQLELLGENLADGNKQALWYLRRLERNLTRQAELTQYVTHLSSGAESGSVLSGKAYQRALAAAGNRQLVLQQRSVKLVKGGLNRSTSEYCRSISADSAKIRYVAVNDLPGALL